MHVAAALLNVALVLPTPQIAPSITMTATSTVADDVLCSLKELAPSITMAATSTVADDVLSSLQELAPPESKIDWAKLQELLERTADTPYKEWSSTCAAAEELQALLGDPSDDGFCAIFDRVLRDGNWAGAAACAASRGADDRPWVVLVTGLNGIRKTTSVYQPWFKPALAKSLGADDLPCGGDSFFRQLDFMIATVANERFRKLYATDDVAAYAELKEQLFGSYRKVAEMVGVLLVRAAQRKRMNVMVETSGRDVASFEYVDHLFPDDAYRKLVLHFTINDVAFAEQSVSSRFDGERAAGRAALAAGDPKAVIDANAGGPYGPAVLRRVQGESDAVHARVVAGEVAQGWSRARIAITAHESEPWVAQADGEGERFEFVRL